MTRKRIILAVVAMLLLVAGGIATSAYAGPTVTGPTFVLQAGPGFTQTEEVAALWSKNTNIRVVVGTCQPGDQCIAASLVDSTACDSDTDINPPAGCAVDVGGNPCNVQIRQFYVGLYGQVLEFNAFGHEVGHCVLHSTWHAATSNDIMSFPVKKDRYSRITKETASKLAALYPRT